MPIYEYHCNKCKRTVGMYAPIREYNKKRKCQECGKIMTKIYSIAHPRPFVEQLLNVTITDRKTGDENMIVARKKQDITDAINKYNDTPEAAKTGKISQVEILQGREL